MSSSKGRITAAQLGHLLDTIADLEKMFEAIKKSAKERADAETKRVNCEQSQAALRGLQSGQRISSTNAAGERVFIDDAERAKEIERTQRAVNDWCK